MRKRSFIAMFLILSLCLSMAACDNDKATLTDTITQGLSIPAGQFEIELASTTESEGATYSNPSYTLYGVKDGENFLVSFDYTVNGQVTTLENVICIYENTVYIKAKIIADFLVSTFKTQPTLTYAEDKWAKIDLPQLPEENKSCITDLMNAYIMALAATYESAEPTIEKKLYAVTLQNKDAVAKHLDVGAQHLSDLKANTESSINTVNAVIADTIWDEISKEIKKTAKKHKHPFADKEAMKQFDILLTNLSEKVMIQNAADVNFGMQASLQGSGKARNFVWQHQFSAAYNNSEKAAASENKTTIVTYEFKEAKSVDITPPEEPFVFDEIKSKQYILALIHDTAATLFNTDDSEEQYTPEFNTFIQGEYVIQLKTTNAFKEMITYYPTANGVQSIIIEIETYDPVIHEALSNYYLRLGYMPKLNTAPEIATNTSGVLKYQAPSQILLKYLEFSTPQDLMAYLT